MCTPLDCLGSVAYKEWAGPVHKKTTSTGRCPRTNNTIAYRHQPYFRTDLNNFSGALVSKNNRSGSIELAINDLQIGVTQSESLDLNQNLCSAKAFELNGFNTDVLTRLV